MNLQKIIDKKDAAAQYMLDEITYICKNFEKRGPGSKGEEQACEYMAKVLKEDCGCDRADVESFKENPGSFFGWIYFTITFVLLAIPLFFVFPLASVLLIIAGLFIVFMQFGLYKKLIDRCFPEKTGHNVTAVKKCTGEVKRRIFFNGHPDAAWEWPVNYKLGGVGFEGHAILCGVGAIYYLVISIISIVMQRGISFGMIDTGSLLFKLALGGLVFVPFLVGLYWMWNKNRIVDGANDNLSGCYMGIAILKALQDEGIEFENTEIGVILSGSEEAGLRGSMAFAAEHKNDGMLENAWNINIDSVADKEYFEVVIQDDWQFTRFDTDMEKMFKDTFDELGIESKTKGCIHNPVGGCDSTPMTKAGVKSVTFAAQNPVMTYYYHTWRDMPDRFELETVGDGFDVVLSVIDKIAAFQEEKGYNGPQKK